MCAGLRWRLALSSPAPGMAQSIREAVGSVCVQVPEAELEYWLFLQLCMEDYSKVHPPHPLVT